MKKVNQWLYYLILLPFLAIIGYLAGYASNSYLMNNTTPFGKAVFLSGMLLIMLAAAWIHTIAHELGHLLFGKLTGYQFCSFRIGSLVLIHSGGKWGLRRHRIPGTAGQCLMAIPNQKEFPYVWYNLGGVIVNIFISILALIPVLIFHNTVQIVFPCAILSVIGFMLAFLNGLPFAPTTTDGVNIKSMRRSAIERHAFRSQLLINEQMTSGVSLKDMPDEWFTFPDDTDWTAPLSACSASFIADRLICQGNLEEAKNRCMEWLEISKDMPPVAELALRMDALLCELALHGDSATARNLRTKSFDAQIKSSKTPAALLLLKMYEITKGSDEKLIQKYDSAFNKACKSYLYPGEVTMLRDLQKRIDEQLAK